MKKGIDFLKAYEKPPFQKNFSQFSKIGMIVIVVFYCFLTGVIIFYWTFLKNQYQEIITQIDTKKSQITQLKKKELLQVLLKQQLSSLNSLFLSKRGEFPRLLSFFLQLSSDEISIGNIKISSSRQINVEVTANSALSFSRFLEKITNPENFEKFSEIKLESLTRQKEGGYSFSLSLVYEKI